MKVYFKCERANSLWSFLYNTNNRPHSQPTIGNWWKPVKGLGLYTLEPVEFDEEMDDTAMVLTFDLKSTFCQSGDFWESMSILCGGNDHGVGNPNHETRGVHAVLIEDWSEVPWMLELDDTENFFVELDMLYLRERIILDPQERWRDVPDCVFKKEQRKIVSE